MVRLMRTILILEPDPDLRELLRLSLETIGYAPLLADSLEGDLPDAELLLVEPQWQPALAAARRLRESRPDLPIVCASVRPVTAAAESLGPAQVLLKPFLLGELYRALVIAFEATPRSA